MDDIAEPVGTRGWIEPRSWVGQGVPKTTFGSWPNPSRTRRALALLARRSDGPARPPRGPRGPSPDGGRPAEPRG